LAFVNILRRAVVLDQRATPYRRIKVTIDAVKARIPQSTDEDVRVTATLWEFQSDHQGVEHQFTVPNTKQWTLIPPGKGTFFLDVYPVPSSPRHAVELRMGFNHILGFHHVRSEGYGAGTHMIDHPLGNLSVRYTVAVTTPAPYGPVND
jgi:hypothetical protein